MHSPQTLDVERVDATLKNIVLPMGLTLDLVTLHAKAIHLESKPFAVTLSAPGHLEIEISAQSLERFLDAKAPGGMRDFEVLFKDGRIVVKGTARMIIEVRAVAFCKLRIEDGTKLFVDLESVDVMGVGAKNMVQRQLDEINPVFDTADLPFQATLKETSMEAGKLLLKGEVMPR